MSATIDFRTLPTNVPVLCIPRVYSNITEGRIRRIFDELDMGTIDRIDLVSKTNEKGEKFNRVFVHYRRWNNSENANNARERLLNGKEIKIIYDEPWFWKVSAYRESNPKQSEAKSTYSQKKASIQFDSDEERQRAPEPRDNRSFDNRPRHSRRDYEDRPRHSRKNYEDRPRHPRKDYEDRPRHARKNHEDNEDRHVNQAATDELVDKMLEEELKRREEDKIKMEEMRVDYGEKVIPPTRRDKKKQEPKNEDDKKKKNLVLEDGEVL